MLNGRVLVVNMNYLGDALMTTPTLALLREISGQPVDVIAGGASGYTGIEILRGNPDIGQLISRVDGGAFARCRQLFQVAKSGGYAQAVILPSIPAYRYSAILAGMRNIIYVPQSTETDHMAEHMLGSVAAQLGVSAPPLRMVLAVQESARQDAAAILRRLNTSQPLIGLNVGATRPQKRWPASLFCEAARKFVGRGYSVVLLGGTSDKVIASEITAAFDSEHILDLTGKTSIPTLAAVIERCASVVSGDTGAMHIAAALEVPVVALFGSTDPAQSGPVGPGVAHVIYKKLSCAPCKSHPTCNGLFSCMTTISATEVVAAVIDQIGHNVARPKLQIVST